jgi:hypothetical protein
MKVKEIIRLIEEDGCDLTGKKGAIKYMFIPQSPVIW